jgi:hypothetical protein
MEMTVAGIMKLMIVLMETVVVMETKLSLI